MSNFSDSLAGFKGILLKGGEGKGQKGREGRAGKEGGREVMRGERREKEGRGRECLTTFKALPPPLLII